LSFIHATTLQNIRAEPPLAVLSVLYLRGYALLAAGQPKEAAAEFQRILDHPGIVLNSLVGSLAHLG
jgi:hypothetical protein